VFRVELALSESYSFYNLGFVWAFFIAISHTDIPSEVYFRREKI